MRNSTFILGLVGFDWDTDRTVVEEAAVRAGRAKRCSIRLWPLNGTERGVGCVMAVLLASNELVQEAEWRVPTEVVLLRGRSWADSVRLLSVATEALIDRAAVRQFSSIET